MSLPSSTTRPLLVCMEIGLSAVFVTCLGLFVRLSLHWPLVNDVSLMHYISFLMDHGLVPYRDFGDMNLPGSFLIDWLGVHCFGPGALASRLFDLALMSIAGIAMLAIARPYGWFAGVFGASMLILFHARDGMGQLGQRDMTMAVLLLLGYAFLFHSLRKNRAWPLAFFGLAMGLATTIKPTAILLFVLLSAMAAFTLRRHRLPLAEKLALCAAGFILPLAVASVWLWRVHALAAFWQSLSLITPYYASLGRKSFLSLLGSSLSPSLQLLAVMATAIAWRRRAWRTWEGSALIVGVIFGLAGYIVQAKGYAYHRYPLVALLMLWMGIEFTSALRHPRVLRALGVAGLVFGGVLAPLYLRTASHAQWSEAMINSLQADLASLGGSQLSGRVQCIDSISGCGTTLYRMQLLPATGLLSDFLVFGPVDKEVIRANRASFWQALEGRPPQVIVVTSWLHMLNVPDYRKLSMWPEFARYLNKNYVLYEERSFPPVMTGPQGYRIYVLRAMAPTNPAI